MKELLFTVVLLTLAVLMGACGGGGTTASNATTPSPADSSTPNTTTPVPAEGSTPTSTATTPTPTAALIPTPTPSDTPILLWDGTGYVEAVYAYAEGRWRRTGFVRPEQAGYWFVELVRSDGTTDFYRVADMNEYLFGTDNAIQIGEGTITLNADGEGYLKVAARSAVGCSYEGSVRFFVTEATAPERPERQMTANIKCSDGSGSSVRFRFQGGIIPLPPAKEDRSPSWSPDGKKIVFSKEFNGSQIYVMDADGTNLIQLTNSLNTDDCACEFAHDLNPEWSPDGSKIVFSSDRDFPFALSAFAKQSEIYMMNTDGSEQTRITFSDGMDRWPSWSSDGKIAFSSERDDGESAVYVMNPDGSGVVRLSDHPGPAVWSPDSSRLAIKGPEPDSSKIAINIVDAAGRDILRLSDPAEFGVSGAVTWSPGGSKIAYSARRGFSTPIFVIDVDGTASPNSLGNLAGANPSWSPDGSKIAYSGRFSSDTSTGRAIAVMDADGGNQVQLTQRHYVAPLTPAPTATPTSAPTPTPDCSGARDPLQRAACLTGEIVL